MKLQICSPGTPQVGSGREKTVGSPSTDSVVEILRPTSGSPLSGKISVLLEGKKEIVNTF